MGDAAGRDGSARAPDAAATPADAPRRPRRRRGRRRHPPGTSPGTLVALPDAQAPSMHALAYGPQGVEDVDLKGVADIRPLLERHAVTWVNVDGTGDARLFEQLGELFGLHRLALEDAQTTHQRAKLERYEGHHVLVARMADVDGPNAPGGGALGTEQLTLFFGPRFVLSVQERAGDCFEPVRARIRGGKGRIRAVGPDYLAYALLDSVVDAYFPVIEEAGERLERLEDDILGAEASEDLLPRVHGIRRDLLAARRALWPLRDVTAELSRDDEGPLSPETRVYLRDCHDHVVELLDMIETLREIAAGLMEMYLAAASNRMNEVIKVLTVISTIFIPLTFIVGVYGMNFDPDSSPLNMPELRWTWGYPFALAIMAATVIALLLFFRRRGWIGPGSSTFGRRPPG